jgi:hypothetical protein
LTYQTKLCQFLISFLAVLLVFSPFTVMPVRSQVVVHPYDWVQVGAYAKYLGYTHPSIVLPNGTIKNLAGLYSPFLFEWTIVDKKGSEVRLNVTLFIQGWSRDINFKRYNITHYKSIYVDIDIYNRESFVDDEPIGKTCFWAEPYKEVGDNVTVFTDPDKLEANVWWVRSDKWSCLEKEFKMYGADLRTEDPSAYASGSYIFSWYTGVAIEPTFFGIPWEVPPDRIGNFCGVFKNGTEYNITRYAGTKLGTLLGIGPLIELTVDLNATNIDPTIVPEYTGYLPYAFIVTFVTTATAFIILRRRKHAANKKRTQIINKFKAE